MNNKKNTGSARFGTQMRGALASKYEQRNHQLTDLWYVYSPRNNCDWALTGHMTRDHHVLMESDPNVVFADYAPRAVEVIYDGKVSIEIFHHAIVTFSDHRIEWHRILASDQILAEGRKNDDCYSAAARRHGARLVFWTKADFLQRMQLIANWRRVVAWMSATRDRSLTRFRSDVGIMLDARGSVTLSDIRNFSGQEDFPLYVAGAFQGVQLGHFKSDLNENAFTYKTLIYLAENNA